MTNPTHFSAIATGAQNKRTPNVGGLEHALPVIVDFGAAAAADVDFYLAAATALDGSLKTVNLSPALPRNVTIQGGEADTGTGNVVVSGLDYNGYPISETIALNNNVAVPGRKAFSKVTTIQLPTAATKTLQCGFGVIMGLPRRMTYNTVLKEVYDGSVVTNGTFALGVTTANYDYYGTYSPNTAPNATHTYVVVYIPTSVDDVGRNNV